MCPPSAATEIMTRPFRRSGQEDHAHRADQRREFLLSEADAGVKLPWSSCCATARKSTAYIEWYDKNCIKLNRTGAANLMIYKPAIKYMFKEGENGKK